MDIKNLLSFGKSENPKPEETQNTNNQSRQEGETYKQYGFRMAGLMEGGVQAFVPCLHSVYLGIKKEQQEDQVLQDKMKTELRNQKVNKEAEKEKEEHNLQALNDQQNALAAEQEEKKKELTQLRNGEYRKNRSAWISLIISGIILIPFTLYFFIFYSSVGYSAFFKEFTETSLANRGNFKLAEAIFDSQALSNAMDEGLMALLFILLMPIIFLAFGFILNKWEKEEGWFKWIKIPLIIFVAFVFDALLSYEICEKIYNLHTMMSIESLPEYSFGLASKDPRFWVIICLGFVSYLIWGITFGYFVKAIDQLDLNKILQEQLNNEIKDIKSKIEEVKTKYKESTDKISAIVAEIQKLENRINNNVFYDNNKIKLELNHFHAGWQAYLAGMGKSDDVKSEIANIFDKETSTLVTV